VEESYPHLLPWQHLVVLEDLLSFVDPPRWLSVIDTGKFELTFGIEWVAWFAWVVLVGLLSCLVGCGYSTDCSGGSALGWASLPSSACIE